MSRPPCWDARPEISAGIRLRSSVAPDGAVVKNWKSQSSTPEMIDFTVKTHADWKRLKPRMAWNDTRINWQEQLNAYEDAQRLGLFTFASFYTGFTRTCDMCGTDTVLMAMADDPGWVQDMLMTRAQLCLWRPSRPSTSTRHWCATARPASRTGRHARTR